MYSGADSCSSCGGCEKRDKYTDSCRGCNQSIKTPFTLESTVYTGLDKFLNGRIVSLYNPFTRNRTNSVTACTSPYKFLPISALEWLFNQKHGTRIYAFKALAVQKFSWLTEPVKIFYLLLIR